jgi:enoyl-[acyl-carrier-protein] reductase (NADH)
MGDFGPIKHAASTAGVLDDVAAMAAFLAADDGPFVTGQVLFVGRGYRIGASHP